MKAFLRSAAVQSVLTFVLWLYMDVILRTTRWTRINEQAVLDHIATGEAGIGCFWHEAIPLLIGCKALAGARSIKILISQSPDGEFVTRAIARHNISAIRGSSGKKSDASKTKGGMAAFREALDFLDQGGGLVIAPDGPRGPARVMSPGTVAIARRSGAAVFFIGLAARPSKRLGTWDRMILPRPFGRGAVVWDGPHRVPEDADPAALIALAEDWRRRLSAACDRAWAEIA